MKAFIKQCIEKEMKYHDIVDEVKRETISQMLIITRGNQTKASTEFGVHSGTVRKLAKGEKK